jgi:uncharacterized membrane protein YkoI
MTRLMCWTATCVAISLAAVSVAAADDNNEDVREMQRATARAKISLAQAIEIAQREVPGGKPLEVELEWKRGGPRIEVELVAGELWKDVLIDAISGKVVTVLDETPDDADDREELRRDQDRVAAATRTFADALEAAQKETEGSKPVEIELTTTGGKPNFEVKLLLGDRLVKRQVAATNANDQSD